MRPITDAVRRAALLMFFPAAYVAGMALFMRLHFSLDYGPIYPFLAALVPIGGPARNALEERLGLWRPPRRWYLRSLSRLRLKLPADKSDWITGYFDVSRRAAGLGREGRCTGIGAVGWCVWPATILDLEGLVTPDAVGVEPRAFLKLKRPDYVVVRTDNAADLLQALQADPWFAQTYEVVAVRRDAYTDREFRAYKRKGEE